MIITKKKKKDYTQRWKSRVVQWKKVKAVQHTNKKQKGDWQDRNPPEEEENNKKKKKRKQEEEGSETQKKKKEEVRFFFFLSQNLVSAEICISPKIGRNWLEWLEHSEIGRNLIWGGMRGIMVPVFMPVRNIPAILAGMEHNQ